jgi:hypothetical protein
MRLQGQARPAPEAQIPTEGKALRMSDGSWLLWGALARIDQVTRDVDDAHR